MDWFLVGLGAAVFILGLIVGAEIGSVLTARHQGPREFWKKTRTESEGVGAESGPIL